MVKLLEHIEEGCEWQNHLYISAQSLEYGKVHTEFTSLLIVEKTEAKEFKEEEPGKKWMIKSQVK